MNGKHHFLRKVFGKGQVAATGPENETSCDLKVLKQFGERLRSGNRGTFSGTAPSRGNLSFVIRW
jgi:hypothetical protein